jgi:caa(3)-type oxidase subunit IV
MIRAILSPLLVWLAVVLLLGAELGLSHLRIGHAFGGSLLALAGITVLLVGFGFMHVRKSGRLAGFFALGAVFWLLTLLGLGSIDPMTRTQYPVQTTTYP